MKTIRLLLAFSLLVLSSGCADITLPTPKEILARPIGANSVRIGMTKSHVKDIWGGPDQVNYVEDSEMWEGPREEWVYLAISSNLPVASGYFSNTKKLYFDGENLTNIIDVKE